MVNLRPFNLAQDISAFVNLLNTLGNESSEADVVAQRQELADLAFVTDVLVAEHDGQLVGFSDIWKNPQMTRAALTLAVHPSYRKQGIGNALFQKSIQNAQALGIESLLVYVSTEDDTTQAFFKRRTPTNVSGFRRFTLNVVNPLPTVQWPADVEVQPYSKINRPQLHTDASNQSWGDLWGHQVVTDQATQMVLATFPHDGIFIALDARRKIVGICKAQEISTPTSSSDTPTGYIDAPGIVPEHRNQQVYTNMLLEAVAWLYNKGHTHMMLESWGDLDIALAAYTDLGFELSEHELAFIVTV